MSSAELTPPPKDSGDELCIICDKPIRDHSFEEQKECATKLSWTKKDKKE